MKQSYRSINQIFYNNNKFDNFESIEQLEKYCLYDGLIISSMEDTRDNKSPELKMPNNKSPELKVPDNKSPELKMPDNKSQELKKSDNKSPELKMPDNKSPEKVEWFHPKQEDTVFWCMYSFFYGIDEFNEIRHSYGNRILEEKMKIVEFIKQNPKALKESNVKITKIAVQEIISEFMVDKITSFQGIAALAVYYKVPIYLIHKEKNVFLDFLPNNETVFDKRCFIYYDKYSRGQTKYKIAISEIEPPNMDSMVRLENHLKPFRPASNYKMEDLEKIARKLGITSENRIKKLDLYSKISEWCNWK